MNNQVTLAQFLPMIIIAIPFLFLNPAIADRKGKNKIKYGLLGILPVVNMFSALYLASLPDKMILERLDTIINKLENRQP